jgi:hypothetical protein
MPKKPAKSPSKSYEIGYRRPPKQFQFKRGRSGNPAGINRKTAPAMAPDLKASLERELGKQVKIKRGEQKQSVTQAVAGISELVRQFVNGDHRARRDLLALADKVGVDLTAGQKAAIGSAIAQAVSAEDEALLDEYVENKIQERLSANQMPHLSKPESANEAGPDQPGRERGMSL